MGKLHEKNTPDFSGLSYARANEMRLIINEMLGCYYEFEDKVKLLNEMWKDLSDYCADKIVELPDKTSPTKKVEVFKRTLLSKFKKGT